MNDWSAFLGLPLWFWLFILPSLGAASCLLARDTAARILAPIWRILDRLYTLGGMIAAVFMVTILVLIVAQMIARWAGITFPGSTEYAGYAMAATSFFAMAHALRHGAHIRVSIILNLNRITHRWLDIFAVFGGAVIATYFARYAIKTNIFSEMLNDRTQGQDQIPEWIVTVLSLPNTALSNWSTALSETSSELIYTPIWVPQLAMSIGTVILAIALWDTLYRLIITGENPIQGESVE